MSILTVKNLSHGYAGREILNDVNFRLLKGEHVGLVGPNGEGKSSFMNLITGKLIPEKGEITWAKYVRVGYLDQHYTYNGDYSVKEVLKDAFSYLFEIEKRIEDLYNDMGSMCEDDMNEALIEAGELQSMLEFHDFYIIGTKIEEVSIAMGIGGDFLDKKFNDLSGGQRSKVLLTKLILEKPDILMLDEPTNYLDEDNIEWLKRYLKNYENAFILISHDISFLNDVTNLIYHVENKELNRYVGNYDDFVKAHEEKLRILEAKYKRQQQEIRDLEDFVARNKASVATRNMAMSRQKKLDKMERIELIKEKPKPVFNFMESEAPGKLIFETKNLVVGYPEKTLTRALNLRMERGDRIVILGQNGAGKTSLVKTILGEIKPLSGSIELGQNLNIGYFKQEEFYDNSKTAIEEIWEEFPSLMQNEVRAALAKCGLMTEQIESYMRVLSGGEQAKVRLCKIMNRKTNILFFDEPTNHLDEDAKQELKRALLKYKGGILLISHEKDFYESIASYVWDMDKFKIG